MQGEVGSTVVPFLRTPSSNRPSYGDRFIPCRSSMDMDLANYLLTEPRKGKENKASAAASPAKEAYRKLLYEALMNNRTRIFSFRCKPPEPPEDFFQENSSDIISSSLQTKTAKQRRYISQVSKSIYMAWGLWDDFYLNLMDWGSSNLLSIALENSVYLVDASKKSSSHLMTVDEDTGPVTSVSWAPDGRRVAIGLYSSDIQLWDMHSGRLLRTLKGVHQSLVGSLAWNGDILTTGGMDGMIVNNDMRERSHIVQTYQGHQGAVCGLKWSDSGTHLASGGSDNLLHIWDISMASLNPPPNPNHQWLYRFQDHMASVKALAWCPFQRNLLASGGGLGDRCIKFWNTHTGSCLNSVDAGSQVCALLWNKNEQELLSSHGYSDYKLTLWNYPSMVKSVDLKGHTSRVLFMAQSPDGRTVASAAGGDDETLRIWDVFEVPEVPKRASKKANSGLFTNFNQIR